MRTVLLAALVIPTLLAGPARAAPAPADAADRAQVRDLLVLAIERGAPLYNRGGEVACAAIYEVAAEAVLALSPEALTAAERAILSNALARARAQHAPADRAWTLRRAFDRIVAPQEEKIMPEAPATRAPAFEPALEAPLPRGFPGPGPLGEVVTKTYPVYRLARAEGGRAAFFTLFRHIQQNDIAMTAPVEMTMKAEGGALREVDMAFLYEHTGLGEVGTDGAVEVQDRGSVTVLSIGLTGPLTADRMLAARRAVEARLGGMPDREAAGDWRLLGYNSPMVPEKKRFYELQLPIAPRGE